MCGRYTLSTPSDFIQEGFDLDDEPDLVARYNIAPTQDAPVVVASATAPGKRSLVSMRWGLIPHFAKQPTGGARAINARCETVAERPTFRQSFQQKRCLVPADGFFEWQGRGGSKQPFLVHLEERRLFAFAGLWSTWRKLPTDTPITTFSIVTCPPNKALASLHDRMPVVLKANDYDQWLDPMSDPATLLSLLIPDQSENWFIDPVSSRVNSVRNDDPSCLGPPEQSLLF